MYKRQPTRTATGRGKTAMSTTCRHGPTGELQTSGTSPCSAVGTTWTITITAMATMAWGMRKETRKRDAWATAQRIPAGFRPRWSSITPPLQSKPRRASSPTHLLSLMNRWIHHPVPRPNRHKLQGRTHHLLRRLPVQRELPYYPPATVPSGRTIMPYGLEVRVQAFWGCPRAALMRTALHWSCLLYTSPSPRD